MTEVTTVKKVMTTTSWFTFNVRALAVGKKQQLEEIARWQEDEWRSWAAIFCTKDFFLLFCMKDWQVFSLKMPATGVFIKASFYKVFEISVIASLHYCQMSFSVQCPIWKFFNFICLRSHRVLFTCLKLHFSWSKSITYNRISPNSKLINFKD